MRAMLTASAVLALSTSALAQDAVPPPVDQMSCDQLWAETMTAGMRMSSQITPEFIARSQAMWAQTRDPALRAQATADMAALTTACGVQGVALVACAPAQHSFNAKMAARTQQNHADMQALQGELEKTTAGVDMQRMQAIQTRIGKLNCPQPTGPGG